MTESQCTAVNDLLSTFEPQQVHHGDCIGADEQFHFICRQLLRQPQIVIHPPVDSRKQAFCEGDITCEALPYLERKRAIVDAVSELIATPKGMVEVQRSGTWSTVRYADKQKKRVHIAWPDGSITVREPQSSK